MALAHKELTDAAAELQALRSEAAAAQQGASPREVGLQHGGMESQPTKVWTGAAGCQAAVLP